MRRIVLLLMMLAQPVWAESPSITVGGSLDLGLSRNAEGKQAATEVTAFVDVEKAGFYGTLSLLRSRVAVDNEVDLAFGYYAERGGFSYDLGYRYLRFPDDPGANYSEISLGLAHSANGLTLTADLSFDPAVSDDAFAMALGLAAELPVSDRLNATLDLSAEPLLNAASAVFGADYALSDRLSLSASLGAARDEGEHWERQWQAGLGLAVAPETTLDLRYLGGSAPDRGYFALALNWEYRVSSD